MMPLAALSIDSSTPDKLLRALGPELGRSVPRTRVEGAVEDGRVLISIETSDLSALRAALNSYLRWIKIAKDMTELTGV